MYLAALPDNENTTIKLEILAEFPEIDIGSYLLWHALKLSA